MSRELGLINLNSLLPSLCLVGMSSSNVSSFGNEGGGGVGGVHSGRTMPSFHQPHDPSLSSFTNDHPPQQLNQPSFISYSSSASSEKYRRGASITTAYTSCNNNRRRHHSHKQPPRDNSSTTPLFPYAIHKKIMDSN